ncbi:MAG: preQ(1) synthase [Blastocatellia bacterium]
MAKKKSKTKIIQSLSPIANKPLPPLREVSPEQHLEIRSTPQSELNLYPLDTFEYEYPGKRIEINFTSNEFTAICPFSDFPDFATLYIRYVPNRRCIELKSLKLYINSFRDVKMFHEHVVNQFRDDFVRVCDPLEFHIEGDFNVRGNIKTVVRASYIKSENGPKTGPKSGKPKGKN